MGLITKAEIVAAVDLNFEDVDMPEWGGAVRVSELSAADVLSFWDACRGPGGELLPDSVQPALLVRSIVNEKGAPLFSADTVNELMGKSAAAIGRLFGVAKRLNGIGQHDAAKNSEAVLSGDSPSGSA